MEHKLVETAKSLLKKKSTQLFFKEQIHRKESPSNQSGMICSGSQIVVLIPLSYLARNKRLELLNQITQNQKGVLSISQKGLTFDANNLLETPFYFSFTSNTNWFYQEQFAQKETVYIIGGGHVGLALSKQMALLNFHVKILDDRPNLNTMEQNSWADEKKIINYDFITEYLDEGDQVYVVIMTFGYRPDKKILRLLLGKKFKYIGMMGSDAKIQQLINELTTEGISKKLLDKVYTPIGIQILSKTPAEIAVSIAAEIIQIKNKGTSTGRTNSR